MAKKITEKIRIWGIVQGVGFRPFVAKVAQRYRMKGQVSNIGGLVELVLTDTQKHITEFLKELEIEKPAPCEIVHIKREQTESRDFDGFTIVKSGSGDDEPAMIPADLSICSDCLRELNDPEDPRYQHPFISCMVCGPRYTIIDKIPYDRENTSMDEFPMCDFCDGQYNDIADRRYHAQTISCHDCGPQMQYKLNGADDSDKPPIEKAAALLREGRVVAFKSMEVCGTHTAAIFKNGIRSLISPKIKLISGPGCPVCVTPSSYIDAVASYALKEGCCVLTFGDMMKVPGKGGSLSDLMGQGASVRIMYSPFEALELASKHPETTWVVAAVGFETTAPSYALMIDEASKRNIENIRVVTALKTVVPALRWICENQPDIDGFICPGHALVFEERLLRLVAVCDQRREIADKVYRLTQHVRY